MDLLAVLLTMSCISSHSYTPEAVDLVWYGKIALQDPHLDTPSNERRHSSLQPIDPRYEVKVLKKTPESQVLKPFDLSKGQVVALVPGQALNCGIGPSSITRTTYMSAKDVLRWSKLAEWLDKYEHRNEVALSQTEDLRYYSNSLYWKIPINIVSRNGLSVHVSDLPGKRSSLALDSKIWVNAMGFVVETKVLLILLVALPLVYGGIHLTTWDFHFASQTEHLLWKIACIDIMGTIPLGVTFFACTDRINDIVFTKGWPRAKEMAAMSALGYINWVLFTPIFVFYALSRIYIVVESFISLRHVPIGVYAAIPWVQDIPHI